MASPDSRFHEDFSSSIACGFGRWQNCLERCSPTHGRVSVYIIVVFLLIAVPLVTQSSAISVSDRRIDDQLLAQSTLSTHNDSSFSSTPKYMIDLYRKFASDRYSTPIANIIRSFTAVTEDITLNSESTEERVYELLFNMSYVYQGEEVLLAELQLQPLIDSHVQRYSHRQRKPDIHSIHHVSILERIHTDSYRDVINMTIADETNGTDRASVVTSLVVTDSIKRWAQQQASSSMTSSMTAAGGNHVFQVRIASSFDDVADDVTSDVSERPLGSAEPLLVVFSNDRKRRKTNERELHEMETHELEAAIELEKIEGSDDEEEKEEVDEEELENSEEDTLEDPGDDQLLRNLESTSRTTRRSNTEEQGHDRTLTKRLRRFAADEQRTVSPTKVTQNDSGSRSGTVKPVSSPSSSTSSSRRSSTVHLERKRRKSSPSSGSQRSSVRNSCRRRPMYVDFSDIHWDNWIIAPKGYQAYECVGQCHFPLSDHLTPTKYALVKSLVQAVHGADRLTPVCCVPTRLEPISILYFDEQGTVTYKYRYDGMVVAECGCR